MKKEIREWLSSSQDYSAGVALYEKYGTNGTLKKLFAGRETAFNLKKLVAALEALAPVKMKEEICTDQQANIKIPEKSLQKDEPVLTVLKKPFGEYPKAVRALISDTIALHNQMGKLHRELRLNKRIIPARKEHNWPPLTPSERKDNALRIVKLDIEHRQAWKMIDYYDATGQFLSPQQAAVKTLPENYAELLLLRHNLRACVSKWKRIAEKATDDDKKKAAMEKLEHYSKQREDVQNKIDAVQQ